MTGCVGWFRGLPRVVCSRTERGRWAQEAEDVSAMLDSTTPSGDAVTPAPTSALLEGVTVVYCVEHREGPPTA